MPEQDNLSREKLSGEAWVKSLSAEEKAVLAYWQTGGSAQIREGLLKNTSDPEVRAKIDAMNKALDKSIPYDGECWRGMHDLDEVVFLQFTTSEEVEWGTFYSSSKSDKSAASFLVSKNQGLKSLMFRIKNKTGVDITPASIKSKAYEHEVILRPGARYKVVGRRANIFTYVAKERIDNEVRLVENTIEALEISLEEI